jgi:[ribosomal protein S18]-alanine N-acetyltransferase
MSRVPEQINPSHCYQSLTVSQLATIMSIEQAAYEVPWTEQVMRDCFKQGYLMQGLFIEDSLVGYYVVQPILDEAHLLNFCIAPEYQGKGLAKFQMQHLLSWAMTHQVERLILEVRRSQKVARKLYIAMGFEQIGLRKAYYPTNQEGQREDALVMAKYVLD